MVDKAAVVPVFPHTEATRKMRLLAFPKRCTYDGCVLLLPVCTNLLAQSSALTKDLEASWLPLVTGIIGLLSAIIGAATAYWLSKKARFETLKLQLDILDKEGQLKRADNGTPPTTLTREDVIASPHAVLTGIQGFIIRFIILYVTLVAWEIVDKLLNPFIQAHLAYLLKSHPNIEPQWYSILAISLYSHLTVIGDILIFFLLGWSLLADIARFVGVRPFRLFRER